MKKLEYQVVSVDASDAALLTSHLSVYGEQGWEIIAVLPLAGSTHLLYIKREKK